MYRQIFAFFLSCCVSAALTGQDIVLSYNVGSMQNEFAKCNRLLEYQQGGKEVSHVEFSNEVSAANIKDQRVYITFRDWNITHQSAGKSPIEVVASKIKISQKQKTLVLDPDQSSYKLDITKGDRELRIPFKIVGNGKVKVTIPFDIKALKRTASNHVHLTIVDGPEKLASNPAVAAKEVQEKSDKQISKSTTDNQVKTVKTISEASQKQSMDKVPEKESTQDRETKQKTDDVASSITKNNDSSNEAIAHRITSVAQDGEVHYQIDLDNVKKPYITNIEASSSIRLDTDPLENEHRITAVAKDEGTVAVEIYDSLKSLPYSFSFDNNFSAALDYSEQGDLLLKIHGGIPPYKILFNQEADQEENPYNRIEDLLPKNGEVNLTRAEITAKGINGYITSLSVLDARANEKVNIPVNLNLENSGGLGLSRLLLPLIGLLGIGAIFLGWRSRQRKKQEAFEQKAQQYQATEAKMEAPKSTPKTPANLTTTSSDTERKKITIQSRPVVARKPMSSVPRKANLSASKFKIVKKESQGGQREASAFQSHISSGNFSQVSLDTHWGDSHVRDVYINQEFVSELSEFLKRENLDRIHVEKMGLVPEVGGFLLGNYSQSLENHQYHLSIEKFVPFVPEYHDLYQIEIGTATLVQELGDAQDQYPQHSVIGWFHTHPGHGLFLSNADLAVHRQFPHPYQVAMEIDSLTDRLDMAVFSWNREHRMNNVEDLHENSVWFSWKDIQADIN